MVEKCTYVVAVQAESLEEALEKASEMPPPLVDHSHKHKQVSSSGLGQTKTLSREDFIDKLPDLVLFRPSGGLGQTKTPDKSSTGPADLELGHEHKDSLPLECSVPVHSDHHPVECSKHSVPVRSVSTVASSPPALKTIPAIGVQLESSNDDRDRFGTLHLVYYVAIKGLEPGVLSDQEAEYCVGVEKYMTMNEGKDLSIRVMASHESMKSRYVHDTFPNKHSGLAERCYTEKHPELAERLYALAKGSHDSWCARFST